MKKITLFFSICYKFSKTSMEVLLPVLLGNYNSQTDRPTDRPADRPGHREVTLPMI